jgi:uncharacterized protein (DUF1810 family)
VRTPDLTRRFEAAIMVIESRRLAQIRATQQEESAARHQLHTLLHEAETALAAGHVQAARAAADQTRGLKAAAGTLPKPTIQRLSRVVQQLGELERWMSFGQHNARVQLCERAEALAAETHPPAQLAKEVQKLRAEWKAFDEQHAGVPKSLWERFDAACEKAYAPAARHFAELHASRKQARKQRDEFIAAAAEKATALLAEPRDLKAIERWLRETDHAWHGGALGSVEPDAWKKLDARLRQALAPLREALGQARGEAKSGRLALIAEAEALLAKAQERDTPAQARALQARWTEHAKAHPLAGRDERLLWERFRAACNAVFEARDSQRKEGDQRKREQRRAFEQLCEQAEQLARSEENDEGKIRGSLRELQGRWKDALAANAVPPALDSRFRAARSAVEGLLGARSRGKEAAVWQALLAKARLCEELDAALLADPPRRPVDAQSLHERWGALPALQPAWEQKMAARRDQALAAFGDEDARYDQLDRIDDGVAVRRDALLELELALGLPSPADLAKERLAVQVRQLRSRFKSAAAGGNAGEILLEWCATPAWPTSATAAAAGRSSSRSSAGIDSPADPLSPRGRGARGEGALRAAASMSDPFDLQRFIDAQQNVYPQVRAELAAGGKRSHWMWFVFPQLKGLGASRMAQHYGIASTAEARAYWAHPLLGARLRECTEFVLSVDGRSAREIFGPPDDLKFRSCMTLFAQATGEPLFGRALEKYFGGQVDPRTVALL